MQVPFQTEWEAGVTREGLRGDRGQTYIVSDWSSASPRDLLLVASGGLSRDHVKEVSILLDNGGTDAGVQCRFLGKQQKSNYAYSSRWVCPH